MEASTGRRFLELFAGESDERLHQPYAVAVVGDAERTGPGGTERGPALLAVADTRALVVHRFDLVEGDHVALTEAGDGRVLRAPVGVAFDAARRLYVCDSVLGIVVRYTADGELDRVIVWGLGRLGGLAIDRDRKLLYVSETAQHLVHRYSLDGEDAGTVGRDLRFPTHLAVDRRGRLIVSDSMNFRVVVFDAEGALLAAVGKLGDGSGDPQRPKGVAADSDDHLYVVDALFDNVQVFTLEGRLLLVMGSAGSGRGELALPAGLACDERDIIYVADVYNGRVVLLRYLPEAR